MSKRRPLPPGLTVDAIMEAAQSATMDTSNPGFCLTCGHEADDCEPDMRHGHCDNCGARDVYGAEECILLLDPLTGSIPDNDTPPRDGSPGYDHAAGYYD